VSRAPCDCGRTSLRIDRLRGRADDMVIYKGVNFYPRQIETMLLRHAGVSHEYQIVLDSEGGGERMTIRVEAEPGCDPSVAARIRRELHDVLALSSEVRLCTHGEIERPQGKAVRVVDRRPRRRAGPGETADVARAPVGCHGAQPRAAHDAPVPDLSARVRGCRREPGG